MKNLEPIRVTPQTEFQSHELNRQFAAEEHNLTWHNTKLTKQDRSKSKLQRPCVLWFTGLSGAGKSTIANIIEQKLHSNGSHTYLLDGDNVRHGLNRDLGFSDEDRIENLRRISEVAWLMADAGLIVLVSFISPFRAERRMARELMNQSEFIEVYIKASLNVCEQRDPKGIYKKARAGEIKNFTGIDSEYEEPKNAEIVLNTEHSTAEILTDELIRYLKANQYV
jgi:adenylyl-sulfate kinase